MADNSFFSELRRRKVLQSAAIYGAVAWGVTEVLVTVVEQLFLPQWVATLAVIGFVVGFPVAMFLAWTFDLTSEGLRRTDVASGRGAASIAASLILLVAGTAGLFFLIKPALQSQEAESRTVAVVPQAMRESYLEELEKFCSFFRKKCRTSGIDYCLLNTAEPLDIALSSYLSKRAKHF